MPGSERREGSSSHHHHHHHHHGLGHHHGPSGGTEGRLWLAFALNAGFAIIELIGGYLTNSVAVMSDALHDFGDAVAIGLSIGLERMSRRRSDAEFSYGYRRYSVVAALATGLILVIGSVFILSEAIPRLLNPEATHAEGMIALALLGLAVNGFAAWRVSKGASLSERMIVLHLLEDVFGWVVVLFGALAIRFLGWTWMDPVLGCLLAVWILFNVFKNLREVFRVFLQGVPAGLNLEGLVASVGKIPGVMGVHHVHVWTMDGSHHIFTAHIAVAPGTVAAEIERLKREIKALLRKDHVTEATLEFEESTVDCSDPVHSG